MSTPRTKQKVSSRPRITFIEFAKEFGRMISSSIGSMAGDLGVLLKSRKNTNEEPIAKTEPTERTEPLMLQLAHNHYKVLMKLQNEYSECMRLIYDFRINSGPLEEANKLDTISKIDHCQSITVDYWNEVFVFIKFYPDFIKQNDLLRWWKYKHGRFVDLVQPLVDQPSDFYVDEEERMAVYNRNIFETVSNKLAN